MTSGHRTDVIPVRGRSRSRGNVPARRVSRGRVNHGDGPFQVEPFAMPVGCRGVASILRPAVSRCASVDCSRVPVEEGAGGTTGTGRPSGQKNWASPSSRSSTVNPSSCTARWGRLHTSTRLSSRVVPPSAARRPGPGPPRPRPHLPRRDTADRTRPPARVTRPPRPRVTAGRAPPASHRHRSRPRDGGSRDGAGRPQPRRYGRRAARPRRNRVRNTMRTNSEG